MTTARMSRSAEGGLRESRTERGRLELAQRAVALIDEQYLADDFDERVLARQLGISVMTLRVRYHRQLGSSPRRYLSLRRVAVAKDHLARVGAVYPSPDDLDLIATRSGFANRTKMDAAFQRHAMMSCFAYWLQTRLSSAG